MRISVVLAAALVAVIAASHAHAQTCLRPEVDRMHIVPERWATYRDIPPGHAGAERGDARAGHMREQ